MGWCTRRLYDIHHWFDDTKSWLGHSNHRLWRHHSEGIFECEKIFGKVLSIQMVKLYIQDMLESNMLERIVIIIYPLQKNG
ncbi:MAG: hypothetical protein CM15mV42_1660 [uncultured marine virus]|nr:MAG: hypothetical protein CM15mV42_1660 [uncultured marine virus]